MAKMKCPGQDPRTWKPEDVKERACPGCGKALEFWKDDVSRKCPECGHRVFNPGLNLGCAEWCRHAEQCLGRGILEKIQAAKEANADS